MDKSKLFYSFITRDGYKGNAPDFFDPKNFKWTKEVENNWHAIKLELDQIINSGKELTPYFDKDIVSKKNSWKTIPFSAWGVLFKKNRKLAPITTKTLDKIPGIVSASFNKLSAQSEIKEHFGDTDGIIRCHLGLVIPGELPEVGFQVNDKSVSWEEGKLLIFCDAHKHKAWNNAHDERYILLFDVIRPEYLHKKKIICAKVLASLFLQSVSTKIPIMRKLPMPIQLILFNIATASAYVLKPLRNLF